MPSKPTDQAQPSEPSGVFSAFAEIFRFMRPKRRRDLYFVIGLMLLGAVAEVATIGAVIPLLSLLAGTATTVQIPLVSDILDFSGDNSRQLGLATIIFVVVAITAGIIRLQLAWSSQNFVFRLGHELQVDMLQRILLQPYSYHVNSNTSTIVASLEKVQSLVFGVLLPVVQACVAVFISLFIVAGLVYIDPLTAVIAAAAFAAIYVLVSLFTQGRLARNSAEFARGATERVKIVQESLGGIRDIIIDSSQAAYLEAFRRVDDKVNIARANTAFIGAAPRFVIEAFGMILIAAIALFSSSRTGGFASAVPILGALALGAQRLLPLLQQIYYGWSTASGHLSVMADVTGLLRLPIDEELARGAPIEPLPLRERITLERVGFSYASRRTRVLENVDVAIPRGSTVALIGRTGSGKSTFADLLMGLLEPTVGRILIDGVPLTHANRRRWQRSIAHVPQAIFLADTSIIRNIALTAFDEEIDRDRILQAAKMAQLHSFVASLPEGYETFVGERGVRLSGGQRQRLGIARAIYKGAPVLVLDEATSALDNATEAAVMEALAGPRAEGRTTIMIAHRLSTVARADLVIRLDNGRVVDVGSYAEVVGASPQSRVY